jgi:uncharacterized protein YggE
MHPALRLIFVPVAVAVALAVAVSALVMAANRPALLIGAPSASTTASTPAGSGVLTTGDATVSLKPDLAVASAGVESEQTTAAAAQSDLAAKAGKLIARIQALGVADKDLSTSGYWVGPTYSPDGRVVTGYRASEELQVKWHEVDTVGKTLDAIVQEGGATHISVGFGLADPKVAQAQARSMAIAEARAKAEAMANAAGVKLGSVVRISDLSTASRYPAPVDYAGAALPASTQVPVGQLDVQVTVEVDFTIA